MKVENIEFTFGWLALELLGKNLYSNAWSAISELVANGFDANANNVYVYINNSDKENAIIEIIDDGTGMNNKQLKEYAEVGRNKRNFVRSKKRKSSLMGRKGIGKLAALYLSDLYYIQTKTISGKSTWKMSFDKNAKKDEKPYLEPFNKLLKVNCKTRWNEIKTGTLLRLLNVNLSGLGPVAEDALEYKLANNFALNAMGNKKIHLCIDKTGSNRTFNEITKKIAFKNMAYIFQSPHDSTESKKIINEYNAGNVYLENINIVREPYEHTRLVSKMIKSDTNELKDTYKGLSTKGIEVEKDYTVRGWLGIHSTIDEKIAKINDSNFTKSKTYNPAQIRLYVRNKLAVENFLNLINNTQAFVNYIEGEIHFDILDDDDFPDIATSNRQGLDESDERITILKEILESNIKELIAKRNALAKEMKKRAEKVQTAAKAQFAQSVSNELDAYEGLSSDDKSNLTQVITGKVEGDIEPKKNRLIFISHARADERFSNFFYYLLKNIGVKESEIFYTTRKNKDEDSIVSLADQIKENIVNDNALILYIPSCHYKRSEYCMFEGGAGWATRSVGEYLVSPVRYEDIPKFLTNGKDEFSIIDLKNPVLGEEVYRHVVIKLNRMIDHINESRVIFDKKQLKTFEVVDFPDKVEMNKAKKEIEDYMDKTIIDYWKHYVEDGLKDYIKKYK
ncbi:ATP-binding protein [Deferribacteres bacterium DY0037]